MKAIGKEGAEFRQAYVKPREEEARRRAGAGKVGDVHSPFNGRDEIQRGEEHAALCRRHTLPRRRRGGRVNLEEETAFQNQRSAFDSSLKRLVWPGVSRIVSGRDS